MSSMLREFRSNTTWQLDNILLDACNITDCPFIRGSKSCGSHLSLYSEPRALMPRSSTYLPSVARCTSMISSAPASPWLETMTAAAPSPNNIEVVPAAGETLRNADWTSAKQTATLAAKPDLTKALASCNP